MAKLTVLAIAIASCFAHNPKADKILYTPDGECFLEKDKSFADMHAKINTTVVKTADRKDYEEAIAEITTSVEARKALVADGEAKAALAERAKKVNLGFDATEKEIITAEKEAVKKEAADKKAADKKALDAEKEAADKAAADKADADKSEEKK